MTKKIIFKTFKTDKLVRDINGLPMCRVSLASEYVEGENIPIAIMEVLNGIGKPIKNMDYYVDGIKYRVPSDLPKGKITIHLGKLLVNSFYLIKA